MKSVVFIESVQYVSEQSVSQTRPALKSVVVKK